MRIRSHTSGTTGSWLAVMFAMICVLAIAHAVLGPKARAHDLPENVPTPQLMLTCMPNGFLRAYPNFRPLAGYGPSTGDVAYVGRCWSA